MKQGTDGKAAVYGYCKLHRYPGCITRVCVAATKGHFTLAMEQGHVLSNACVQYRAAGTERGPDECENKHGN
jgi:hypothetical protein